MKFLKSYIINHKSLLIIILLLAAIFRFYGLNWDQGYHLHPDERMITMVADRLTLEDLNPHFFAYGSLPIYLLKLAGLLAGNFNPRLTTYDQLNLVGRFLSALFDLGTIITLYFLGKKLLNQTIGLLAAFFYTISVLPIQLSHFYAVDTPLTFFTILTLYFLIRLQDHFKLHYALLAGLFFGLSLATKTSAILLVVPIIISIIIQAHKAWPWNSNKITKMALNSSLLIISTLIIFFLTMPYALLDLPIFLKQTLEQQQMTKSAFTFPYTLQYVGKIPYLYELKNIYLWGLGPLIATLAFPGTLSITFQIFRNLLIHKSSIILTKGQWSSGPNHKSIIILVFFWLYFAIVGSFAIGFMRYMLPLYPLLCLFTAVFVYQIFLNLKSLILNHKSLVIWFWVLVIGLLIPWPLSFINIYSQPNTRIQATNWINNNIPTGTTIATEHWDDGLPIGTQSNYQVLTMPMYDPDTPSKWNQINQILDQTQYIIIASNRLYTPLSRLTDCPNLPPGRCYTQTAQYYQKLFDGSLGFSKVAEFFVQPNIPLINIPIDDSSADESFTVYDHPRVMIFQKNMLN